jgi:hypothetical protein
MIKFKYIPILILFMNLEDINLHPTERKFRDKQLLLSLARKCLHNKGSDMLRGHVLAELCTAEQSQDKYNTYYQDVRHLRKSCDSCDFSICRILGFFSQFYEWPINPQSSKS